jgi:hypothetical protein
MILLVDFVDNQLSFSSQSRHIQQGNLSLGYTQLGKKYDLVRES